MITFVLNDLRCPAFKGPIEVEVYTKAPEVKLYLNDRLIDTKKVDRNTQFKAVFTLPYAPGTIRATTGAQAVSLTTAGQPAQLRLTSDRRTISANGQDLAFITIEVLDSEGNPCPEAAIPCEVSVSGQGRLMAATSADLKDTEPYPTPRVTTWKGRALAVVRSTQRSGQAKVAVDGRAHV